MKNLRIGDVLKEQGLITEQQIEAALVRQKETKERLGQTLVDMGFISEQDMLRVLANKLDTPFVNLKQVNIERNAVVLIPETLAVKYNLIAVSEKNNTLTVATNDPLNYYGLEDIRAVTGMTINVVVAEKKQIDSMIRYYYSEYKANKAATEANLSINTFEFDDSDFYDAEGDDSPTVKLLNTLLVRGYETTASDIHIEPFEDKILVRMRLDGELVEVMRLDKKVHASMMVRIKIQAGLDIAEKRIPQDGHFVTRVNNVELNLRVSLIPTIHGEKAVMRYLDINTVVDHSQTYGMSQANFAKMKTMLKKSHGIIYITGPTGSGKTTTLYMILESMLGKNVNISTIEDPVERKIEKINQMQINNRAGLTFESGLRALLRQDPDVILVGETRDSETASISVRAAITGHLVLSTLHTNDAISAVVRLKDMGIEPYLVSSSVIGIVSQRLIRKLCPVCSVERDSTAEERIYLGDILKVHEKVGCNQCNHTGYRGRTAIHEMILMSKDVRTMIAENRNIEDIYKTIKQTQNITSLKEEGIELVKQGITSVEELEKVVSE